MRKLLIFVAIISVSTIACKKKEKAPPTKTELLTQGKWKLSSASAAGGLVDLMSSIKDCQKDNTFTFNTDKTITVDEGATKCNDTAQQTVTDGNWALLNNDAQMSISGEKITVGFGAITGDVVKIEATTFQIKKDTVVSNFQTSAILTFTNVK